MPEIYSQELLDKVEEYASYLMLPSEIAFLVEMNEYSFKDAISNKASQLSKAYFKGKINTTLAIRKQEVELAKVGSPLAVEHASKYITDMDLSENE